MSGIVFVRHLSVALLVATIWTHTTGASPNAVSEAQDGTARFIVTLRGVRIGTEDVTVSRPGGMFKITATGQIGAPIDLITTRFELTYSSDWQPQELAYEGAMGKESMGLTTTFGITTASSDMVQGTRRGSVTHQVSPRATVLPVNVFAAYEALAARITQYSVGSRFAVYVAPEGEVFVTLNKVTPRRISLASGIVELKEYDLTLQRPRAPMSVQIMVDGNNRLARVIFRDLVLAAIRDDFATVMAREVKVRNPGDEDVFIASTGFSLAATATKPATAAARMPAVVLVGGAGRQDRDETQYGVSIFGELAGRLAENGCLVVRFDKRGLGQSGGRPEHAGLNEYADDVVSIVEWLKRRKDVDANRIVVVTHGEGSAVGMLAASKKKDIKGLAMLAAPGLSGREVVLEQQRQALTRRGDTPPDREAKIQMQTRIINAVVTGHGLDDLPTDVRKQADTPLFKSWLTFDPAVTIKKVSQPVLIAQGAIDLETPVSQADRLAELASARKVPASHTAKVIVPGVNHLLVEATSGDPDEYETLSSKTVAPGIVSALVEWLKVTFK
jgi:pimeloyl-ACP methyl ester carboxylesterase